MSACGTKQTLAFVAIKSAFDPKQTCAVGTFVFTPYHFGVGLSDAIPHPRERLAPAFAQTNVHKNVQRIRKICSSRIGRLRLRVVCPISGDLRLISGDLRLES